ncbi:hypothetical protein C8K18_11241 [Paraburkholderia sp. GV068]|nr:hypothetical protein C8K19_113195 [Paraburkholderia sp. GV072]PUB01459.1 hypothetical protein C8K18_11241 [Paraburkholderia sp. GV068]
MRAATTSVCRSLLIRSAARRLCQRSRRASAALARVASDNLDRSPFAASSKAPLRALQHPRDASAGPARRPSDDVVCRRTRRASDNLDQFSFAASSKAPLRALQHPRDASAGPARGVRDILDNLVLPLAQNAPRAVSPRCASARQTNARAAATRRPRPLLPRLQKHRTARSITTPAPTHLNARTTTQPCPVRSVVRAGSTAPRDCRVPRAPMSPCHETMSKPATRRHVRSASAAP